jgi:hypothetical protein
LKNKSNKQTKQCQNNTIVNNNSNIKNQNGMFPSNSINRNIQIAQISNQSCMPVSLCSDHLFDHNLVEKPLKNMHSLTSDIRNTLEKETFYSKELFLDRKENNRNIGKIKV